MIVVQILGRDILISLIAITITLAINTKCKNQRVISLYNIGIILFSISIVIIFSLTGISPISGFNVDIRINEIVFIPFVGIVEMFQGGLTAHTIINVLGNIIMFLPLGFLLPLLWRNLECFKKTVMFGFGISLLIEFTQLFLTRATDIDDLILNTLGTMLGYLTFIIFKKIFPRFNGKLFIESIGMQNKFILWICILVPYVIIVIGGFYDRYML